MTFAEQDAVLRGYARLLGYRLQKRPSHETWGVYRMSGNPWRLVGGGYKELLRFFEGVQEGRRT